MEWCIMFDPSDLTYIIVADKKHALVDSKANFWLTKMNPIKVVNTVYDLLDYTEYSESFKLIHSFTSDDPIDYIYNTLPNYFPEFFI